jgi:hypothetical protein
VKPGDLVQVTRNYEFVNIRIEDVEVYTVHPSMDVHGMHEISEVKIGTVGLVTEFYKTSSRSKEFQIIWIKVLFPAVHGWIDSTHLDKIHNNT